MPFSQWPGAIFSSGETTAVALAPAEHADAPVLTLPAGTPQRDRGTTRVIPLGDTGDRTPAARTPQRTATRLPKAESRAPRTDDPEPDTKPTTAPAASPAPQPAPSASAASPAAENGPAQPTQPAAPAAKRVKLAGVTSSFASASDSGSGQPELKVQMAVADDTQTAKTRTVALSLKLAPTDVQTLMRNAAALGSAPIALETEVDVVDSTVASSGPACTDGTCLRVQMKFAQDTRTNPAEQPEVSLSDEGDAISNRVKVVVKIAPEDLGVQPAPAPAPAPGEQPAPDAPAAPAPAPATSVLSLPLPPTADADPSTPDAPAQPATDTTTVTLPDADPAAGTPDAPAVQVKAQLEVVDTPVAPAPAADPAAAAAAPAPAAAPAAPAAPKDDCR